MSVEAPPVPPTDVMEGIIDSSATDPTVAAPAAATTSPTAPELVPSETLYIQNLNEKIKVDSMSTSLLRLCQVTDFWLFYFSYEADTKSAVQELRKRLERHCTSKSTNARPSFRGFREQRDCCQGPEGS